MVLNDEKFIQELNIEITEKEKKHNISKMAPFRHSQ